MKAALCALLPLVAPQDTEAPDEEAAGITQEELEQVSRAIEADVAALRGASFLRPVRVEVADEEELMRYMLKRLEMEYEPGELEAEGRAAKLLGLLPPDMDLMAELTRLIESQVGGYYDPDEDAFYLMSRFANTGVTRTIIAHELTHALDDQLFGIDEILEAIEDNSDRQYAFHAVVEGSGTAVMQQWSVAQMKAGELSMSDMMEAGDLGLEELGQMPEYIWKPMFAAYLRGQTFLSRTESAMAAGMNPAKAADIDAAFRSPPLSTEQILHPRKYWDPEHRDDPTDVRLDASALEGWTVVHENTLGELVFAMVVTPEEERDRIDPENPFAVLGVRYTNDAAEGWDGDRYVLLEKGDAALLVGATVWDTPEDAREFHAAIAAVGFAAEPPGEGGTRVRYHAARGLSEAEAADLAAAVPAER